MVIHVKRKINTTVRNESFSARAKVIQTLSIPQTEVSIFEPLAVVDSANLSIDLRIFANGEKMDPADLVDTGFRQTVLDFFHDNATAICVNRVELRLAEVQDDEEPPSESILILSLKLEQPPGRLTDQLIAPILDTLTIDFHFDATETFAETSEGETWTPPDVSSLLQHSSLPVPLASVLELALAKTFAALSKRYPLIFNQDAQQNMIALSQTSTQAAASLNNILKETATDGASVLKDEAMAMLKHLYPLKSDARPVKRAKSAPIDPDATLSEDELETDAQDSNSEEVHANRALAQSMLSLGLAGLKRVAPAFQLRYATMDNEDADEELLD